MPPDLVSLLSTQSGVVSRGQLLSLGLSDHDIARLVRGRLLVRLHRSAYLDHTGSPTWEQRCWAAVLTMAPAALAGESALRAAEGVNSRRGSTIHVAIPWECRRQALEGVRVVRTRDFATALHPGSGLPRIRYEHAVLDVLQSASGDMERISQLTLAVNSRRTSAARLRTALDRRPRLPGRKIVERLLEDIEEGTCSVLEHGHLTRIERPHGLPPTSRQVRAVLRDGVVYRDAVSRLGVCLELDGRLHERGEERERDFDRDLAAAAAGLATVRLSYGQVYRRPCWTAGQLGRIYRAAGWSGEVRQCRSDCEVT